MDSCKHEAADGDAYTEAHAFDHSEPPFLSVAARIETSADATRLAGWLVLAAEWLAARERKEG